MGECMYMSKWSICKGEKRISNTSLAILGYCIAIACCKRTNSCIGVIQAGNIELKFLIFLVPGIESVDLHHFHRVQFIRSLRHNSLLAHHVFPVSHSAWQPHNVASTAWCCEIGSLTSLMDVTQVHPVTTENQFSCTRLYMLVHIQYKVNNRRCSTRKRCKEMCMLMKCSRCLMLVVANLYTTTC